MNLVIGNKKLAGSPPGPLPRRGNMSGCIYFNRKEIELPPTLNSGLGCLRRSYNSIQWAVGVLDP